MADSLSRKLAVILHADVVGSTLLGRLNETIAHQRILDAFQRFTATIETYGGHTRELRGDALVAEFERASDAIAAALVFQAANEQLNTTSNDNIRPSLRVGIAMGEVVIANDTITGDGVVLAQRLEGLAEPGSVILQDAAFQTVPKHLPFEFVSLGKQTLKGFDDPVPALTVTLKPGAPTPPPERRRRARKGMLDRTKIATIGFGVLFLTVVLILFEPWEQLQTPKVVSDKPSIVVLPFTNMSADPAQEYFADGMTDDLITGLSRVSGLFVIARHTSFTYKGKSQDVAEIARELGVRHILEGSVRRADNAIRVNAQLIDAASRGHVWARQFDGSLSDVFGLQDKVTSAIVQALAVTLTAEEQAAKEIIETRDVRAYDEFLRGWQHFVRQTPDNFRVAIAHFEKSVELDPQYGRAYAALAATYWEAYKRYWPLNSRRVLEARFKAEEFLRRAQAHPTALAHQVAAEMLLHGQQYDEAHGEAESAIALDPNDPDGHLALASVLILTGRPQEGYQAVRQAMALNPHYPSSYLYVLGLAQFTMNNFADAEISLHRATTLNPLDRWSARLLLAAYGHLNQKEKAEELYDSIETRDQRGFQGAVNDPITVRTAAFWHPFKHPEDANRFAEGLRKAGIPE